MANLKSAIKLAVLGTSLVAASSAFSLGAAKSENFNVKMRLVPQLTFGTTTDLSFPDQVAGETSAAVVAPQGAGGAIVNIKGQATYLVDVNLTSASIIMYLNGNTGTADEKEKITVDTFKLSDGTTTVSGTAVLAVAMAGTATDVPVYVGATANPATDDKAGDYTGSNTISAIYQ